MQEPAKRALKLLQLLEEQSNKGERLTELLRDPDSGATPGWSFHVPACFNDALDIRQTERKVNGKSVSTWTQSSNFAFRRGDFLFDTDRRFELWSEALEHIHLCLQVKATTPMASGDDDGTMTPGTVTFEIFKPTGSRNALIFAASHSLSQAQFVRFLITGKDSPAENQQ